MKRIRLVTTAVVAGAVFTGAERLSRLTSAVRSAVAGGTGSYAGAEGNVEGAPATVDGRPASRMTFELSRK